MFFTEFSRLYTFFYKNEVKSLKEAIELIQKQPNKKIEFGRINVYTDGHILLWRN